MCKDNNYTKLRFTMENDIKEYNKQQNEDRFKNQTNINNTNELNFDNLILNFF